MNPTPPATVRPRVQVEATSGRVPLSVRRLMDLEYLERAMHRMLCGWGNQMVEWDDKVAVCRHVWEQAEIVERLRRRIDQFPGVKAGAPVFGRLESLANAVLLAPDIEDAIDGIYQMMNTALVNSYLDFIEQVHSIHDAPTHAIVREIVAMKDGQRRWRNEHRLRHPHAIDTDYRRRIEALLSELDGLRSPLPANGLPAEPVGVRTAFRPRPQRIKPGWYTDPGRDIMPYICGDFADSIEARRLFWPIGYMREMNLAQSQLLWLYDAPDMPWAFCYDESRHLWDESRHGDSGHARLRDFDITIEQVAYTSRLINEAPHLDQNSTPQVLAPMSPTELYEALFFIGLIAETGHFRVKREAYDDFRAGGDLESAEMMLYDIIDETTHVQYAHKWLPVLAKRAGIDHAEAEQLATAQRRQAQAAEDERIARSRQLPRTLGADSRFDHYQRLLVQMRRGCPLTNADTCPPRSSKPM